MNRIDFIGPQNNPPHIFQPSSIPQAFTPVSSHSTLSSIDPRTHASHGLSDFFSTALQKIANFFKSLFNRFALFLPYRKPHLSPAEKETYLCPTNLIRGRLAKQKQHCQRQMEQEPVKSFRYSQAPTHWDAHEEVVGGYRVGVSHVQGRRPTMEDEHLAVAFNLQIAGRNYPVQLFGVFDGHGGPLAAQFVRANLQRKLTEVLQEFNPTTLTEEGVWKALKITGVRLNADFKNLGPPTNLHGTTATVAMVIDNKLCVGNIGDSRTVLDNNGTPIQLTEDAEPDHPRYKKGIEYRGGTVEIYDVPRVNGNLALARAIGDHGLNGAISARSKITITPLSEIQPGSHLILCCDGIYDVSRTKDVVAATHRHRNLTAGKLAANLTYSAYQSGSGDNLSALVVKVR